MGFAYVLRHTGCDVHLVRLLSAPVRSVRPLLLPATVVIGFLVNIPIISQASTAAAVGAVLLPLLRAAGVPMATAGAALLLGASIGGELLNPGAIEYNTVTEILRDRPDVTREACVRRAFWPVVAQLVVATVVFWALTRREATQPATDPTLAEPPSEEPINLFKAAVPIVPIALLFLFGPPRPVYEFDWRWLIEDRKPATAPNREETGEERRARTAKESADRTLQDTRRIGLAMLIGAVLAALAGGRKGRGATAAFFEGGGYAYTHIIARIAAASGFGAGVKSLGVDGVLKDGVGRAPGLLVPLAIVTALGFAALSGSAFATTQSFLELFIAPAAQAGQDELGIGILVSMAAATGRTMTPVSAVSLMCATLSGADPLELSRRVVVPLLVSLAAAVAVWWLV
jgi:DcuC family C4-dicarboxylate transporter